MAGDVLLQPLKCWACSLIAQQENSAYSHMGIYLGDDQVAEAFFDRVKIVSLQEFMQKTAPKKTVRVRRLKYPPAELKSKLSERLKKYLGLPYDRWFLLDEQRIYCSELVYKLLRDIEALQHTHPKPMWFDKNPEYWDRYFRGQTPRGELGISPEDFHLSLDFMTVDEISNVSIKKNRTQTQNRMGDFSQ